MKKQYLLFVAFALLAVNIARANSKDTPEQEEAVAQKLFKEGHYREAFLEVS